MPHDLLAIHGISDLVVAVGDKGRILMFGGSIYEPFEVVSPTRATLRGVWVQSPMSAWAVGDDGVNHRPKTHLRMKGGVGYRGNSEGQLPRRPEVPWMGPAGKALEA